MPLVFSPLSEDLLELPPRSLLPKHAFIMRQLGAPPPIDLAMNARVIDVFAAKGYQTVDAASTTGSKDYLERILGLIRSTGFTVAIFSHETRPDSMANIALELGFAAMCGKPLVIVKTPQATAPSDLKRTDWIEYEPRRSAIFGRKLGQALSQIESLYRYENDLLETSLAARSPDCGVALERASKGFLLSGQEHFITAAERVLGILETIDDNAIADLERLRRETRTFIRQARAAM